MYAVKTTNSSNLNQDKEPVFLNFDEIGNFPNLNADTERLFKKFLIWWNKYGEDWFSEPEPTVVSDPNQQNSAQNYKYLLYFS